MKLHTKILHGWVALGTLAINLSVPTAKAADDPCFADGLTQDEKLECLFPNEDALIEASPQAQGESETKLPSGDIIEDFLPFFINTLLGVAGTLIFTAFLYAGYKMVFANDNEENINSAKKTITYAIIGAFVIAISYAVIYGVANLNLD